MEHMKFHSYLNRYFYLSTKIIKTYKTWWLKLTKDSLMKFNNLKNKKSLIDLGFKDGSAICIVNNLNQMLAK